MNNVIQLTKFLDSSLLPLLNHDRKNSNPFSSDALHAIFLQAFVWSVGACLKQEDRLIIDASIKYLSGLSTTLKAKSGQLPNERSLLFDHCFQLELDRWIPWDELIPNYEHDPSKRFSEIFVPTVDTIRLGSSMNFLFLFHFLVVQNG